MCDRNHSNFLSANIVSDDDFFGKHLSCFNETTQYYVKCIYRYCFKSNYSVIVKYIRLICVRLVFIAKLHILPLEIN